MFQVNNKCFEFNQSVLIIALLLESNTQQNYVTFKGPSFFFFFLKLNANICSQKCFMYVRNVLNSMQILVDKEFTL